MTTPFVAQLRSRPGVIRLGADGQPRITIRVQLAEAWDTVRVETSPTEPVGAVKAEALTALRKQMAEMQAQLDKLAKG